MKKKNRNKLLLFSVVAACLNGVFVGSMSASVFAASSLNVTIANTISLDIMPKTAAGTFTHSSTSDNTVSVSTNNYTGYTLGIAASTANDNALSYKENNTVVDSINSHNVSAGVSETNYANDSYASSNNLNNTWGYRPSKYNSEDNTTTNLYYPAPTSTSTTILDATSVANPTTSNNYNIAIGARVGLDKTPGAYTNTFVITVVANPTPYTITYNANAGSDTVTNMPSNVTNGLSHADTVNVDNPANPTIPTRTGYNFAGWCVSGASETSCDGTLYSTANNNLASFPINNTASSNNINVYAIWTVKTYSLAITFAGSSISSVKVCKVSGNCSGTNLIGAISSSGNSVSGLAYGTAYYLYPSFSSGYTLSSWAKTDSATGSSLSSTSATNPTYTMGEGNGAVTITGKSSCESTISGTMQAFDPTKLCSGVNSGTLTDSRDTQSYTVAKLADGKWWMTKNLNLAGGTTISCDTSDCDNYTIPTTQGWQSGGKLPASSTSGFSDDNYAYVYNSNSTTCGDNSPCYSYYSWDAATLGSGRSISTGNRNAPYSICPKGWRLPTTYDGSGTAAEATDFRALMIAFGGSNSVDTYSSYTSPTGATMSTTLRSTPNNFLLAGAYSSGEFGNGGSYGGYWSATSYSSYNHAYYLRFSSTYICSAFNHARSYGVSVRCVYGG